MKFTHRFRVAAPLERVAGFHRSPASLAAITPPPLSVTLEMSPPCLVEGSRMAFTIGAGPLGIYWVARITGVSPEGFTDHQLRGPFRRWIHRHGFASLGPDVTEVRDEVNAEIPLHPIWGPVALGMWISLPLLFTYRAWRTRTLLEIGP